MKNLFILLFTLPFLITNCDGFKKCKDGCGSYGDCMDGDCECLEGTYKIDGKCNGEDREKFIKTYSTTSTICNGGSFPQGTPLSISRGGSDPNDVQIIFGGSSSVFVLEADVIGMSIIVKSGQVYGGDEFSGSGTLSANGNLLLLTITRMRSGSPDCVFNISGT